MDSLKLYGALIGVILVVMTGCSNEKKLLRQQVAAQADSLTQLRGQLQERSDSVQGLSSQLAQARAEADSIANIGETNKKQIGRLNSQLKVLRDSNSELKLSLDRTQAANDSLVQQVQYYSTLLADTVSALAGFRAENIRVYQTMVERDSLLAQIRPWYSKWKHDATKRNFIEVLFGSDKARRPDFPEPAF